MNNIPKEQVQVDIDSRSIAIQVSSNPPIHIVSPRPEHPAALGPLQATHPTKRYELSLPLKDGIDPSKSSFEIKTFGVSLRLVKVGG